MITERPVTPSDFEAALNAAPRSDAELIEGFRVTPRGRAITDLLAEYEDRRKGLEAQEVTHTSQLQSNPVGSTGQSKVTTAKWDKNAETPTSLTKSTPAQESKQRKSVVWADEKSKPLEESAEPHASDEENDPDSWLLPSSKSVAKAVQRNTLSLFGRIWTILMGIATSETFKFVQKGPGSIDTDALFEGLFHAGVDMDVVVLRAKIFSEKVLKCCVSFCKRYQVKSSIRDDMILFLSTMYVRESSVVLHTIEERVISFIFLKVVADTVGGSLKEEIANRVAVDTVVRNETGGAMTLVEVEAIARGVFYT
ncbi:hypothetical protein BC830DRAFT_1157124 [Chytriomyces sp. MP71]|nr:hypothetical protein BC830DRAFT_1157124 [Chytriomyces sp. MP71]